MPLPSREAVAPFGQRFHRCLKRWCSWSVSFWRDGLDPDLEDLTAFLALEANGLIGYGNFDLIG